MKQKTDWALTLFTIASGIGFVYAWVKFWYFQEIIMSRFNPILVALPEYNENHLEGYYEYLEEMESDITFDYYLNEVLGADDVYWTEV